jgi:hypothetical protein
MCATTEDSHYSAHTESDQRNQKQEKSQKRRTHSERNPDYTFDSFIVGDNSSFAFNACLAIAKNPGTAYNPCLIYGGVGLGKTHLIQSVGNYIDEYIPELRVMYVTAEAFTRSYFGNYGQYIISIGLMLFAFSTAVAWSYYGDRSVTYLIGSKYVIWYRVLYVVAFFFASFTDTTIIWSLSYLTVVFMAIPNLIGLLLLRKEARSTIKKYWFDFKKENPNYKHKR